VVEVLTDFPSRFAQLRQAFLENSGPIPTPVVVEHAWPHKGRMILKFAGIDSIDGASRLRGCLVFIPEGERMPLPSHHYYISELRGCRVVAERQGVRDDIGTVTEVEPTGGVDILHVARSRPQHGEVLIPLAQSICTRIDPEAKLIVIEPPEDLLDLNE
jgi:16S rRNA processing protein RimM